MELDDALVALIEKHKSGARWTTAEKKQILRAYRQVPHGNRKEWLEAVRLNSSTLHGFREALKRLRQEENEARKQVREEAPPDVLEPIGMVGGEPNGIVGEHYGNGEPQEVHRDLPVQTAKGMQRALDLQEQQARQLLAANKLLRAENEKLQATVRELREALKTTAKLL